MERTTLTIAKTTRNRLGALSDKNTPSFDALINSLIDEVIQEEKTKGEGVSHTPPPPSQGDPK